MVRTWQGLSPRGRGKRYTAAVGATPARSIPAWAGETRQPPRMVRQCEVYPRVGGGNRSHGCGEYRRGGLSPRGRGKRHRRPGQPNLLRSIPAWAGETALVAVDFAQGKVYPRVGGGNVTAVQDSPTCSGLSPRGRGKLRWSLSILPKVRSIPAWAGETRPASNWSWRPTVYPRVGGGNNGYPAAALRDKGLSPRGRGKR